MAEKKETKTKPKAEPKVESKVKSKTDPKVELKTEPKVKSKTEEKKVAKTSKSKKLYTGTGRRKRSVARVWLYEKKGEFIVNGKTIKDYFNNREATLEWVKPFHSIGVSHPQSRFSATIKVAGGGMSGQLGAVRHGLARALVDFDPENQAVLRTAELMTRDSRKKERKKAFFVKARKKPQYSKR